MCSFGKRNGVKEKISLLNLVAKDMAPSLVILACWIFLELSSVAVECARARERNGSPQNVSQIQTDPDYSCIISPALFCVEEEDSHKIFLPEAIMSRELKNTTLKHTSVSEIITIKIHLFFFFKKRSVKHIFKKCIQPRFCSSVCFPIKSASIIQ